MLLVYLDPYLLGDPLFLTQLARDMAHRAGGALLVHGSGEAGERALEATGAVARQRAGVWAVESPEQAALVERATRELNRQIVHELNEAGVPTIRLIGADRGLLKNTGGVVTAGGTQWLATLLGQGVVGVLASLVQADQDELVEIAPLDAVAALATATDGARAVVLATGSSPARTAYDAALVERLQSRNVSAEVIARGGLREIASS